MHMQGEPAHHADASALRRRRGRGRRLPRRRAPRRRSRPAWRARGSGSIPASASARRWRTTWPCSRPADRIVGAGLSGRARREPQGLHRARSTGRPTRRRPARRLAGAGAGRRAGRRGGGAGPRRARDTPGACGRTPRSASADPWHERRGRVLDHRRLRQRRRGRHPGRHQDRHRARRLRRDAPSPPSPCRTRLGVHADPCRSRRPSSPRRPARCWPTSAPTRSRPACWATPRPSRRSPTRWPTGRDIPVVVDPVMVANGGAPLLGEGALGAAPARLIARGRAAHPQRARSRAR